MKRREKFGPNDPRQDELEALQLDGMHARKTLNEILVYVYLFLFTIFLHTYKTQML